MLNTTKVPSTLQVSHQIKKNLEDQIHEITNHPEIYAQSPFDFSRNRKLSFETTIKIILSFGGQSLSSELLSHFNFTLKTPTASALVQARSKIKLKAFEQLFYRTIPSAQ
ncbi:IS4 family transposase, partial [Klebsiella pneumoniae]